MPTAVALVRSVQTIGFPPSEAARPADTLPLWRTTWKSSVPFGS